jgi:cell division septation protein DedD
MAVRRRKRGIPLAGLLVLLGVVGVLGGTLALGFFAGRYWPRVQVLVGLARPTTDHPEASQGRDPARAAERASAGRRAAGGDGDGGALPKLTFYRDLTAPAEPPALPSRRDAAEATKARKRGDTPVRREDAPGRRDDAVSRREASAAETPPRATTAADIPARVERPHPFAVQLAAYTTRAQAEALRQRLAAKGFSADVSDASTPGGTRWRVRVGTYASREEARAAAERLAAATSVGAVVVRAGAGAGEPSASRLRGERDTADVRAGAGAGEPPASRVGGERDRRDAVR